MEYTPKLSPGHRAEVSEVLNVLCVLVESEHTLTRLNRVLDRVRARARGETVPPYDSGIGSWPGKAY